MINPGSLAGQIPAGDDALIRRIQDLERVVREMQSQDVLRTAGLVASPNLLTVLGGLTVSGTETVSGDLNVTGTETVGGNLNVTGSETVSGSLDVTGSMTVGGTLSLPNGIIGNAALANPVVPVSVQADEGYPTGFTLTALEVAHAVATVTVPSGYTTASVVAISTARGISNSDWNFGMKTRIGSNDGNRTTFGTNTSTNSGGTLSGSCANTTTLSSLAAGGTFNISTVMSVNSGTPAVSVTTVAMVWFLR